jgi:hypothetical protein
MQSLQRGYGSAANAVGQHLAGRALPGVQKGNPAHRRQGRQVLLRDLREAVELLAQVADSKVEFVLKE